MFNHLCKPLNFERRHEKYLNFIASIWLSIVFPICYDDCLCVCEIMCVYIMVMTMVFLIRNEIFSEIQS